MPATTQPPNLTRGHHPLIGLLLSNPDLIFTPGELHTILASYGHDVPMRSVTLIIGQLAHKGTLTLDGAHYRLTGPLPPSRRERHSAQERVRAQRRTQASPARKPRQWTAAQREKMASTRQRKTEQMAQGVLAHFRAVPDPTTPRSEKELARVVKGNVLLLRDALRDLSSEGQLHSAVSSTMSGVHPTLYWLPTRADQKRAPKQLNTIHHTILSRVQAAPAAVSLVELGYLLPSLSADQRLGHALDLYHAGQVQVRPVGATILLRAM